jgi:hypothetical protein
VEDRVELKESTRINVSDTEDFSEPTLELESERVSASDANKAIPVIVKEPLSVKDNVSEADRLAEKLPTATSVNVKLSDALEVPTKTLVAESDNVRVSDALKLIAPIERLLNGAAAKA